MQAPPANISLPKLTWLLYQKFQNFVLTIQYRIYLIFPIVTTSKLYDHFFFSYTTAQCAARLWFTVRLFLYNAPETTQLQTSKCHRPNLNPEIGHPGGYFVMIGGYCYGFILDRYTWLNF